MNGKTLSRRYLQTLVQYFEEEISGEAYFLALTQYFDEPDQREKLILMAQVERYAAEEMRPLLRKYDLTPRTDSELHPLGRASYGRHEFSDWNDFMTDISVRYPNYLVQFAALENMAPGEDRQALRILTNHEVAAIAFADLELAGDTDSAAPMRRYLRGETV